MFDAASDIADAKAFAERCEGDRHHFRFTVSPEDATQMADLHAFTRELMTDAERDLGTKSDGKDRLEAALARRLDRMSRQIERLERHVTISNEAIAVFVRFWLTSTPPLPDTALSAAQIKGRERYAGFVEALGRRLARGRKLVDEVSLDVDGMTHTDPENP